MCHDAFFRHLQVSTLQQELAAVAADRDQLRVEVERLGTDCAAAKTRLASAESVKAGLEVCQQTVATQDHRSGTRYHEASPPVTPDVLCGNP